MLEESVGHPKQTSANFISGIDKQRKLFYTESDHITI